MRNSREGQWTTRPRQYENRIRALWMPPREQGRAARPWPFKPGIIDDFRESPPGDRRMLGMNMAPRILWSNLLPKTCRSAFGGTGETLVTLDAALKAAEDCACVGRSHCAHTHLSPIQSLRQAGVRHKGYVASASEQWREETPILGHLRHKAGKPIPKMFFPWFLRCAKPGQFDVVSR